MFLNKFVSIDSDELTFPDNELAVDDRVIRIDGLTKDDRGDGIMHACETQVVQD